MALANVTLELGTTANTYINLPITNGISRTGYWIEYRPASANNDVLAANVIPHQWGSNISLVNSNTELTIEGTIPLIYDNWNGANVFYQASAVEWIGIGINDITNTLEADAFYFAHLGSYAADDDAFYWDRIYLEEGTSEWDYYQYHKHLPSFYARFEQGRQTTSGGSYIVPEDKEFGYIISNRVSSAGVAYLSNLARIHTPSIGGAHNSHNDVNLPTAVSNANYMNSGILHGTSNRFHAFYITASGSDWKVYSRTYTAASGSFTPEADLGVYDLADPILTPADNNLGDEREYPIRASCGDVLTSKIYLPVILNNATSGYDLEIWAYDSEDVLSAGTLVRHSLETGVSVKPDCVLLTVGTTLYALYTDSANGGLRLKSYNGSIWIDEGRPVTNGSGNPLRVHGFKYNSADVKYYALISGTSDTTGTYTGPGMYSFEISGVYTGYSHLDYDAANNTLISRGPLTAGYLEHDNATATLKRYTSAEPQGISADKRILSYEPAASFFNKIEINLGGEEYYFDGIELNDGRRMLVGRIENLSYGKGRGDLLVSLQDADDPSDGHHFAWGGAGDDYVTGVTQGTDGNVWITGYTKSELVEKRDFKIHGWCRNINDGANVLRWTDIVTDSTGNIFVCGNHESDGYIITAKYDYNYNLIWQKSFDAGSNTDIAYGIACDSADNLYICGSTDNLGSGNTDALLFKIDTEGTVLFTQVYGTVSAESATDVAIINKSNVEYVALSASSGSNTVFIVTDSEGISLEKVRVSNLSVNKIETDLANPTSGRFLFAGTNTSNVATFGMCEFDSNVRMVQWIDQYKSNSSAVDIVCVGTANQNGAGADYVIAGSESSNTFIISVQVDEDSANTSYNVGKTWGRSITGVTPSAIASNAPDSTDQKIYVSGHYLMTMANMSHDRCYVTKYDGSGNQAWQNYFGHHGGERFTGVTLDVTGENFITCGWSMSHTVSTAGGPPGATNAIIFRGWEGGYGTGVYHLQTNPGAGYEYNPVAKTEASDTTALSSGTPPSDISIALNETAGNVSLATTPFTSDIYDGSYGTDGVFTMFLARIQLDKVQNYLNSDAHEAKHDNELIVDVTPDIFEFWQVGTVGDASADDGNMFSYDVLEHSSGEIVCAGVTSGDVTKVNTGTSGVYDYLLFRFDPVTETFRYFQAGSAQDEEIYALTELSNGTVAFTGRTTGNLGANNIGGYDIFLGIYDMDLNSSDYYSTGSGFDDRGLNIHDVNDVVAANTLVITYSSYGAVGNTTNSGSEDMGAILFNYATDTWGNAYQTGSATSEVFTQNGSHSALLDDGRLAIVAHSAGYFADDSQTSGLLDIALGIINLNTGEWRRYQTGTGANDFGTAVFPSGEILNIAGHTEASFDDGLHGLYVQFDALKSIRGKDTSS